MKTRPERIENVKGRQLVTLNGRIGRTMGFCPAGRRVDFAPTELRAKVEIVARGKLVGVVVSR